MDTISFKIIEKNNITDILPLLSQLNKRTPAETLKERVLEMAEQNYECAGMYHKDELIGICGLWFVTRHYAGKSAEPDHVYIKEAYQSKGLGKTFFQYIENYLKDNGIEAMELNTYTENRKSHKFYYNLGMEIYGYHFLKILRKDGKFY